MTDQRGPSVSLVLTTYNRAETIKANLSSLATSLADVADTLEFIVVDNASSDGTAAQLAEAFPWVRVVVNPVNLGAVGRNSGIEAARGEIVITLDDDVGDLTVEGLERLRSRFAADPRLGALCFKVLRHTDGSLCNWCHHLDQAEYQDRSFLTYEISEGAVAFRRSIFAETGYYLEDLFISHEGIDLAIRILDAGYTIEYDGQVSVVHSHDESGRPGWRRYYYDTRNTLIVAYRHMSPSYGFTYLVRGLGGMFVFSMRDRYPGKYLLGIGHGLKYIAGRRTSRRRWRASTEAYLREIDRHRPPLSYYLKNRLFRKKVEI